MTCPPHLAGCVHVFGELGAIGHCTFRALMGGGCPELIGRENMTVVSQPPAALQGEAALGIEWDACKEYTLTLYSVTSKKQNNNNKTTMTKLFASAIDIVCVGEHKTQ